MTRPVVTRIEPQHVEAWLAGRYKPPQRARCRLAFAAKLSIFLYIGMLAVIAGMTVASVIMVIAAR